MITNESRKLAEDKIKNAIANMNDVVLLLTNNKDFTERLAIEVHGDLELLLDIVRGKETIESLEDSKSRNQH